MRWFEQQRINYIAETLRALGYINREHLIQKFGISTPQASHDLTVFQRIHPNAIKYDRSAKRYVSNCSTKEK